jgi:hypothetical protein
MTKLTIDDKEYDTENFTEDQLGMLRDIEMAQNEVNRLAYSHQVMDARRQAGIASLTESLNADNPQSEMDV